MEGMEKHERWSEGVKNAVLRGSRGFGWGWSRSCDGGVISCEELRVDCVVLHMLAFKRGGVTPFATPVMGSKPPNPEYPPSGSPPCPLNWPSVVGRGTPI
jgi:hypothetical protein